MVIRPVYLEKLRRLKDKHLIKVVTGIRRCGKSTLLEMFQHVLLQEGVKRSRIITVNLEDGDFLNISDYKALYALVGSRLVPGGMNYVFLDEVQRIDEFEKAVDSLYVKKNVDLYITGSNAHLLSGELATLLSGRYVEIAVLPFSFKEYMVARGTPENISRAYSEYLQHGSFPYLVTEVGNDPATARDYLSGVYNTVLLKDIVQRTGVKDVSTLESVVRFMFDNIGNLTSIQGISHALTSAGRKTTAPTIDAYVRALCDAFVLYRANRYDVKGKAHLKTGAKYYMVDLVFRPFLLGNRPGDVGHILENVIYLELLRRGHHVFIGKVGATEIDFVTIDGGETTYYQVAASVREQSTLERELAPLKAVSDNHPKFLLTLDDDPSANYEGIRQLNALDFLMQ
ncbi:MAG: ATP-binding protein [bacterium]